MRSLPSIYGTVESMFEPPFRKINFDDEPPMIAITRHLRRAWTTAPPSDTSYNGVNQFLQTDSWRSEQERRMVPQNLNKDNINTTWRKSVCFYWNHIFFDIMNFLPHAQSDVGHFHVPNSKMLAIEHPKVNGDPRKTVIRKKWDTNILIIPAFLDRDVSIRFESLPTADENTPWGLLGVYDGTTSNEVWYIRKDFEVNIHVETGANSSKQGIAAVMVYAILCSQQHGAESQNPSARNAEWRQTGQGMRLT